MNERDNSPGNAKSDRDNAALADLGITPSEASLFYIIHFGARPPSFVCSSVRNEFYRIGGPVTVESAQEALTDCLEKSWLQVVDEATLERLRDQVHRERLLGPIYGFPMLGGVEFTRAGADQWFRVGDALWDTRHSPPTYREVVHEKTSHYFRSESRALLERDRWRELDDVVALAGPFPVGPWRAEWWRRFSRGFRTDVEQRGKWQGRAGLGRPSVFLPARRFPVRHAQDVLDRHNVARVEWLVMASLERADDRRRIIHIVTRTSRQLGIPLAEPDCLKGLAACLRNGWLRRVDARFTEEITRLLDADIAIRPVPFDSAKHGRREFDFSEEGAFLYRMLAAEIFGQDWEDDLIVRDPYFREEHWYGATEAGLEETIGQHYLHTSERLRSSRIVPIGPWCANWWEPFESGLRVELTFGEP